MEITRYGRFIGGLLLLQAIGGIFAPDARSTEVLKSSVPSLPSMLRGLDLIKNTHTQVDLTQAGKGTVIVFLSSKCPCSASHEPVLKELAEEFKGSGFEFVGIHSNSDEPDELTIPYFRKSGLPFPVLADTRAEWADAFAAYKTPHVFVVNPQLQIVFQGGVDSSHQAAQAKHTYLKNALQALRAGKEPSEKQVRVLGCAIRRPGAAFGRQETSALKSGEMPSLSRRSLASVQRSECSLVFKKRSLCAQLSWTLPPKKVELPTEEDAAEFTLSFFNRKSGRLIPVSQPLPESVEVKLFMPSMGHGSSPTEVTPSRDASGKLLPGKYQVKKVLFSMPGTWEIQVWLKRGEKIVDHSSLPFEVN